MSARTATAAATATTTSTTTGRTRRTRRGVRLTAATTLAAAAATALVATASPASALSSPPTTLQPGQSVCVSQYASYQVRGDGWATGDGARFKILRNGAVVTATPGRVNYWAQELRSAYGTFPGPGYYSACAYNTGSYPTTVTVSILTDHQF